MSSDEVELIRHGSHHSLPHFGSHSLPRHGSHHSLDGGRFDESRPGSALSMRSDATGYSQASRRSSRFTLHSRQSTLQKLSAWQKRMLEYRQNIELFFRGQLVLDPEGDFRRGWDKIVVFCVTYNVITVPWFLTFDPSLALTYLPIDMILLCLMLVDMLFVFRTGFLAFGEQLVFDSRLVARRYITGWRFPLDLLSVLPIEFLAWVLPNTINGDDRFTLEFWYAMLKVKQLLRLHKILANSRLDSYFQTPRLRVMKVFILWILMAHYIACLLVFVGLNQVNGKTFNWMISSGMHPDADPAYELYVAGLYWATITLSSVGYGDKRSVTTTEQSVGLVILISALCFYAGIFSSISAALSSFQFQSRAYQKKMDSAKEFAAVNGLPPVLSQKLDKYERNRWRQTKGFNHSAILDHLPLSVQSEVLLYIHSSVIQSVPFFRNYALQTAIVLPEHTFADEGDEEELDLISHPLRPTSSTKLLDSLILRLKPPAILLAGDYLFREGDTDERSVFFIKEGRFTITQENPVLQCEEEVGTITPQAKSPFFGEISLLLGIPRTCSVSAAVDSVYNELPCADFFDLLSMFPEELESCFQPVAIARCNADYSRVRAAAEKKHAGAPGAMNRRNALTAVTAVGAVLAQRMRRLEDRRRWADGGGAKAAGEEEDDGFSSGTENSTTTTTTTIATTRTHTQYPLERVRSPLLREYASTDSFAGNPFLNPSSPFTPPTLGAPSFAEAYPAAASSEHIAPLARRPGDGGDRTPGTPQPQAQPFVPTLPGQWEESKETGSEMSPPPPHVNSTPPLPSRAAPPGDSTVVGGGSGGGLRGSLRTSLLPVQEERAGRRAVSEFELDQRSEVATPTAESFAHAQGKATAGWDFTINSNNATATAAANLAAASSGAPSSFSASSPSHARRHGSSGLLHARRRSLAGLRADSDAAASSAAPQQQATLESVTNRRDARRSTGRADLLLRLQQNSTRDLLADSITRAEESAAAGTGEASHPGHSRQSSLAKFSSHSASAPQQHLRHISLPAHALDELAAETAQAQLTTSLSPPTGSPVTLEKRASLKPEQEEQLEVLAQLKGKRDSAVKRGTLEASVDGSANGLFSEIQASLRDEPAAAREDVLIVPPVAMQKLVQSRSSSKNPSVNSSPNTSAPSSAKAGKPPISKPPAGPKKKISPAPSHHGTTTAKKATR